MPVAFVAILLPLFLFILGSIVASFVGVLAERIYTGSSWRTGRSCCNSCARSLSALDLIPVFSWVFAGGKCRLCGCRIPWEYAFTELLLGGLFVASYIALGITIALPFFLCALTTLLFIVLYDLRHTVVPFTASFLFFLFALAVALLHSSSFLALGVTLLTAGGIGLFFFLLFTFSKGRAMGLGDAPVALAFSLLVGHAALPGLLFSFWIGAVIGVGILLMRPPGSRMGIEVPFVPFLAAGFLLAFFTQWNPLLAVFW